MLFVFLKSTSTSLTSSFLAAAFQVEGLLFHLWNGKVSFPAP